MVVVVVVVHVECLMWPASTEHYLPPSLFLSPSLFAYMRALAALDPLQQLQCGLKLLG